MLLDNFFVVDNLCGTAVACPTRREVVVEADIDMIVILNLLDLRGSVVSDKDEACLAVGCRYRFDN